MDTTRKKQFQFSGAWLLLTFAVLLVVQSLLIETLAPRSVSYSEFLNTLRSRGPGGRALPGAQQSQDLRRHPAGEGDVRGRVRGRRSGGRARRGRGLPEEPGEVPVPRRSHPEGCAARGPAGHGQDAARHGGLDAAGTSACATKKCAERLWSRTGWVGTGYSRM
jgi:hypothetical protein